MKSFPFRIYFWRAWEETTFLPCFYLPRFAYQKLCATWKFHISIKHKFAHVSEKYLSKALIHSWRIFVRIFLTLLQFKTVRLILKTLLTLYFGKFVQQMPPDVLLWTLICSILPVNCFFRPQTTSATSNLLQSASTGESCLLSEAYDCRLPLCVHKKPLIASLFNPLRAFFLFSDYVY